MILSKHSFPLKVWYQEPLINNTISAIIVKSAIIPEKNLWTPSVSSCHSSIIEQITQNIAKKPPKTQDIIHKTWTAVIFLSNRSSIETSP